MGRFQLAALLIFLGSCTPHGFPDFYSRCDVGVYGPDPEGFQKIEDKFLEVFDAGCQKFFVFTVPSDGGVFVDQWGRVVTEYTDCVDGRAIPRVVVGWTGSWPTTAANHGRVHITENCADADPAHTRWQDAGIYELLQRSNE